MIADTLLCYEQNNRLHVAWVGDSKAVLGRIGSDGNLESFDLTFDHKPKLEKEEKRIKRSNGRVEQLRNEPIG